MTDATASAALQASNAFAGLQAAATKQEGELDELLQLLIANDPVRHERDWYQPVLECLQLSGCVLFASRSRT